MKNKKKRNTQLAIAAGLIVFIVLNVVKLSANEKNVEPDYLPSIEATVETNFQHTQILEKEQKALTSVGEIEENVLEIKYWMISDDIWNFDK